MKGGQQCCTTHGRRQKPPWSTSPGCMPDLHQPQARGQTLPKVGDEPGSSRDPSNRPVGGYSDKDPDRSSSGRSSSASEPPTSSPRVRCRLSQRGPIHPTDYLAHNHRVLCYAVTGLASCGRACTHLDYDPRGHAANGRRRVRRRAPDRRLARQAVPRNRQSPTLTVRPSHFS